MIIRTTNQLAKQICMSSINKMPLAKNPFVDWTCRVFAVHKEASLMLITNTASLYSFLAPANGLENLEQFVNGLIRYLERHLLIVGFEDIFKKHIVPELETLFFAKSLNRSVTGSMTDMVKITQLLLIEENYTLEQVAKDLNETPFKALEYNHPRNRFFELTTRHSSE